MGHPRSDEEKAYLEAQLGNRWQRLLSNSQIFNWFADYTAQESKIDREKIVRRLRVFSSRDEDPTAFWTVLMTRFYEEGAHLGLRKYVDGGVTYYCPPEFYIDFKALCQSAPSFKNTVQWIFRPDYLSGWIFAHVFSPGSKNWFKKSWPDALKLRGRRHLVSYHRAGTSDILRDFDAQEYDEASLENYRSGHSLLCLLFNTTSPAAFDISFGEYTADRILEITSDPYLGVSKPGFGDAALEIAGFCVTQGLIAKESPLRQQVLELLKDLSKAYSQLESTMLEDADFMHLITYPLMPLAQKANYSALMVDFETGMKAIVIENSDEIAAVANRLKELDGELSLHADSEELVDRQSYSVEVIKRYLTADAHIQDHMALEAFEALLEISEEIKGKASDIVHIAELKRIVRQRVGKLTDTVEATGAFPVIGPLQAALAEVGYLSSDNCSTDYGDLLYRNHSDRPWLSTDVKFLDGNRLEDAKREFLAYCRIVTREQQ